MAGLTLDAGALIAADRNDRRFWAHWKEALRRGLDVTIPAVALAQAWRGSENALLGKLAHACIVEPFTERNAKATGELCARAKISDIVDAAVASSAATREDVVLTGDPKDLVRLANLLGNKIQILTI